jgi:NADH dehydrogenase FAD-containing subunit
MKQVLILGGGFAGIQTAIKCDKQCYIVAMEPQKFSLYKPEK